MRYISVDIGVNNLGIAWGSSTLDDFMLYTIEAKSPVTIISELKSLFIKVMDKDDKNVLIVEKQMNSNTKAFGLMYGLIGLCTGMKFVDVVLFDPIQKFAGLNITYDSKKKEHKKISAQMCEDKLRDMQNTDLLNKFLQLRKKDDVADAVNMLLLIIKKK